MKKVIYATVRDSVNEWNEDCLNIECRFDNNEKYAAIHIPADFEQAEELAQVIAKFLSKENTNER